MIAKRRSLIRPSLVATLTNTGTGTVTFKPGYPQAASLSSPAYGITASTCGTSLAPGDSCALTVTFAPQTAGSPYGNIFVYINESTDLFFAGLTGTGATPYTYTLSFDQSTYSFGSVAVGSSKDLVATLTNTGTGTVTFKPGYPQAASLSSPAYSITASTCGVSLAPGDSCVLTVTFAPQIAGSPYGNIFIYVNESSDLFFAGLTGTGAAPYTYTLAFDQSAYSFGSVAVGSSKDLVATLTNTGTGTVTFKPGYPQAASLSSPAYGITASMCGTSLAPGDSCALTVTFAPQTAGSPYGNIFVYVNESTDLFFAGLTGTGSDQIFANGFEF